MDDGIVTRKFLMTLAGNTYILYLYKNNILVYFCRKYKTRQMLEANEMKGLRQIVGKKR